MHIWPLYASPRLHLFHQEQSSRVGMHAKGFKAGWDNDSPQRVLDGGI